MLFAGGTRVPVSVSPSRYHNTIVKICEMSGIFYAKYAVSVLTPRFQKIMDQIIKKFSEIVLLFCLFIISANHDLM